MQPLGDPENLTGSCGQARHPPTPGSVTTGPFPWRRPRSPWRLHVGWPHRGGGCGKTPQALPTPGHKPLTSQLARHHVHHHRGDPGVPVVLQGDTGLGRGLAVPSGHGAQRQASLG